ncbi:MAG: hypothetical protein GXP41_09090 [Chloroflexi bacterium]|nr:hypothetical protein [Chloroflexota bacterium]
MNPFRLLINLIDRPTGVFAQVRDGPRRLILVPFAVMFASIVFYGLISAPLSAKLAGELIQQRIAQLPAQQAQAAAQVMTTPGTTQIALSSVIGGTLLTLIGWVLWGAILHFVVMMLGANSKPGQMIAAVSWAAIPHALRNLVMAGFVLISGSLVRNQGLSWLVASGNLLKDSQNPLYVFLAGIDIFWLWGMFLLTVAVAVVAGFSRRQSLAVVLATWVGGALLTVIPTFLSSMFMGRAFGG